MLRKYMIAGASCEKLLSNDKRFSSIKKLQIRCEDRGDIAFVSRHLFFAYKVQFYVFSSLERVRFLVMIFLSIEKLCYLNVKSNDIFLTFVCNAKKTCCVFLNNAKKLASGLFAVLRGISGKVASGEKNNTFG